MYSRRCGLCPAGFRELATKWTVDDEQTVQFYGIGTDQTIRYGVIKRPVMSNVPKKNGKELTWQQYRKETESRRKQLRSGLVLPTSPFCS